MSKEINSLNGNRFFRGGQSGSGQRSPGQVELIRKGHHFRIAPRLT